jgi:hypothetical protein
MGKIDPLKKFIFVCEGRNTEPHYINALCNHLRINRRLYDIDILAPVGVPETVLNRAIEEQSKAKKSSFPLEIWIIFDKDDVEDATINKVFAMATARNIHIGYSNPCLEIWPLLHLKSHTAHIHRHDLQRLLNAHMPNYDHEKGAYIDFDLIAENSEDAIKRAQSLEANHLKCGSPLANPSTTMYKLVESLQNSTKKTA